MDQPQSTRVVVADPHPAFRVGLRRILEDDGVKVIGEAADGEQAAALVGGLHPDLLLTEFALPKRTGMQVLDDVNQSGKKTSVLFVTAGIPRTELLFALRQGLRGLILKDVDPKVYPKAVRCVQKGEVWVERDVLTEWASSNQASNDRYNLTDREFGIIREILSGRSNKEIAANLELTEDTVKRHLTNVFRKLNVSSRLELSLFAMHHRLVS